MGQASCVSCDAGKFTPTAKMTVCTTCDAGKWSSAEATTCIDCTAGLRSCTSSRVTGLLLLSSGKFEQAESSTACTACVPGKYTATEGMTVCRSARRPLTDFCPFVCEYLSAVLAAALL